MSRLLQLLRLRASLAVPNMSAADKAALAKLAGAALIAGGALGIDLGTVRKRRLGLFGALFLAGFGVMWIVAAQLIDNQVKPYSHGLTTTGVVVSAPRTSSSSSACRAQVSYSVEEHRYEVPSSFSSSSFCGSVGDTVQVSYLENNPGAGRPLMKSGMWILNLVRWVGIVILVLAVWTVLVRLVEMAAGAWLLLYARRLAPGTAIGVGSMPSTPGFPLQTAPQPRPQAATQQLPTTQHQLPPPGWYDDPERPGFKRWWTGTSWAHPS